MSTENRHNVEIILKRLLFALGFDTDQQLADWLGVGNKVLSAWKARNSRKAIAIISSKCGEFNLNWVLTGEGEPKPNELKQYTEEIGKTSVKVDQFNYAAQKKAPNLTDGAKMRLGAITGAIEASKAPDQDAMMDELWEVFLDIMRREKAKVENT